MTSGEIRQKYIQFFVKKGHKEIPSASLVPENDPTTLFTSSGMQPLVQYLLGQPHPLGKRLVNSQKSFRTIDIDEVGDNRHTTFFEMLGNWSLGGYFKKEQLPWFWEFLTKEIHLDPQKLFVTVFEGNASVPKDNESIQIWKEIFSKNNLDFEKTQRIFTYPAKNNWWSRSGEPENMPPGEPGGPDSEVFYDFGPSTSSGQVFHTPKYGLRCHPNCECGRFLEIGNSVFMQYQKMADGTLKELPNKNVDFGGGLERLIAATQNTPDIFQTDLFTPIIRRIEVLSKKKYGENIENTRAMRIIADHIKAGVMMMADGVVPSNKQQGYVLRRLIRRSLLYGRKLGLVNVPYLGELVLPVAQIYQDIYPQVLQKKDAIKNQIEEEALRFGKSLEKGLKEITKIEKLDGVAAFKIYETFGFPWEMTEEIARERGQKVERGTFEEEFTKHREKSRTAAAGIFKGGLQDNSEEVIKYHTTTHLLHQALRMTLGDHVQQKGSNITAERLRFDFSHSAKLTPEQITKVENIINEQIQKDLPVSYEVMTYAEAIKKGVLAFFGERYPEKVKVYTIGSPSTLRQPADRSGSHDQIFSREICGGPHIKHTGVLGSFKIIKEEALGAGIRRIYGELEK